MHVQTQSGNVLPVGSPTDGAGKKHYKSKGHAIKTRKRTKDIDQVLHFFLAAAMDSCDDLTTILYNLIFC